MEAARLRGAAAAFFLGTPFRRLFACGLAPPETAGRLAEAVSPSACGVARTASAREGESQARTRQEMGRPRNTYALVRGRALSDGKHVAPTRAGLCRLANARESASSLHKRGVASVTKQSTAATAERGHMSGSLVESSGPFFPHHTRQAPHHTPSHHTRPHITPHHTTPGTTSHLSWAWARWLHLTGESTVVVFRRASSSPERVPSPPSTSRETFLRWLSS